jgi:hypothetical protein
VFISAVDAFHDEPRRAETSSHKTHTKFTAVLREQPGA